MSTEKDYDNRKKDYDDRELSNSETYDTSLMTFLTSTFGFSLLVAGYYVVNDFCIPDVEYLVISWILILLAIILYIVNFWIAGRVLKIDLKRAEQCRDDKDHSVFDKKENWGIYLKWINISVGVFYIVSLISITIFLIKNLI